MKIRNYKLKIVIPAFVIFFLLSVVNSSDAAELFFDAKTKEVGVNQQFQIDLILNTEGESVNAIEGEIVFPASTLEFQEIRDGASFISFWVKRPFFNGNSVIFSGILPGGYKGGQGYLFSLVFRARKLGEATIDAENTRVLRNDPTGSPALVRISSLKLQIKEQSSVPEFIIPEDRESPEPFTPQIAKDPNVFNGKWFLVFATQDKGSGIDHYEVQENRKQKIENRMWVEAESPYVLKDQKLRSYIYVKSIDKKGNERIATLSARNQPSFKEKYLLQIIFGIIIIVGAVVAFIFWRIVWPRLSLKK